MKNTKKKKINRDDKMEDRVNKDTYNLLVEQIDEDKMVPWDMRTNLLVHPIINELFKGNRFLQHVIFDSAFDILKNVEKHRDGRTEFGKINRSYFDHYYAIEFKDTYDIGIPEIIAGVMNFPYIYEKELKEFIEGTPVGWETYLINPVLMNYGTIGLFLTPEYCDGAYIEEINGFILLKTGYPLFLKYDVYGTFKDIKPITYTELDLNVDDFIKRFNFKDNKGLAIMLDFWKENDCVSCVSFDTSFKDYSNNRPFSIYENINFKSIKSSKPFKITIPKLDIVLGAFKYFSLDCAFMCATIENNKEFCLFDEEMQCLIDGDFEISLIDKSEYNSIKKEYIERDKERSKKIKNIYMDWCITHSELIRPNKVEY